MPRPPGSLVRLTYDGSSVSEGDYLRTHTTGRLYRVVTVRRQERGKHAGRQHVLAQVMPPSHVVEPDADVLPILWYSRTRRRTSAHR